jgi:glycosyltransferase involved in cell wall biosynthesis
MPNVVHVTYSPYGGAGKVANQLSEAIQRHTAWDSEVMTFHPSNLWTQPLADWSATASAGLDEFIVKKPGTKTMLSLLRRSSVFSERHKRAIHEADIVHLHWVEGMLQGEFLETIMSRKPGTVFWTLHDMRPLTGGCHFSGHCRQFESGCSSCPIVRKIFQGSVSLNLNKREVMIQNLSPNFIAPGPWMKRNLLNSKFGNLPCRVIPNPLSDSSFATAKKPKQENNFKLGFVAQNLSDPRKGLDKAKAHVRRLVSIGLEIDFQLVGSSPPKNLAPWEDYRGFLSSVEISDWMFDLDFLLFTSLSDNAPLVLAESLAAGTPILIASGTGADEMVTLGEDSLDLETATISEMRHETQSRKLSHTARILATKYRGKGVAQEYVNLYEGSAKPHGR